MNTSIARILLVCVLIFHSLNAQTPADTNTNNTSSTNTTQGTCYLKSMDKQACLSEANCCWTKVTIKTPSGTEDSTSCDHIVDSNLYFKMLANEEGKTFENVDLGGFCTYFRGNLLVKPDNTTERTVDCCMCSTMAVQGGSLLHISVAAIMGTVLFFVNQVIVEAIVVM
eukprot:TRINITY_DN1149_c0_g1_i25.p2 TRINITY_DN1149_c0_g1~~TRINITY_DN1149_c0_g1_i25.p2  ORF type:complete len:169 (+),score=28.55 TRINITY_DN1149_c0_g1_i25:368-874(+)